ncbi:hypothetical protein PR202_ga07690 [Eleusine coracana subsp. coracana]|uniref:Non-haem dioxygenase N-terminal domain-containing protein n=1 Tax=Eleusine coracana subsp. coracana TaxID=191504 RepID=A0AAV5BZD0_ELECO|nr:hypothetical protein PR202_ga07690 [Eleusine coracana subsp. coracana]
MSLRQQPVSQLRLVDRLMIDGDVRGGGSVFGGVESCQSPHAAYSIYSFRTASGSTCSSKFSRMRSVTESHMTGEAAVVIFVSVTISRERVHMAEQLLSTAVHDTVPVCYVRPESQRPRLAEVVAGARIPVVDLACPDRAAVVSAIGDACRSHGFFQVLNHGIDAVLIGEVMAVARAFFRLPPEEKAKLYSDDPARKMRLSISFNVRKETVHNWRDYLRLHCHPLDQFVPDWPSNPPDFKYVCYTANTVRFWYALTNFLPC